MRARLSIMLLAVLVCSGGLLLAPGVAEDLDQAGGAAWRFDSLANTINSTLNDLGALAFGLLVGTLLICFFDPTAKEEIFRGIKSVWRRPSRS
jgi:hypothetical protein